MTKRLPSTSQNGVLWVALGASLWGTDTVLRRPLTQVFSAYQIVFIEHAILTLILFPLFWRTFRTLTRAQWGAVLFIAWGGSACGTLLFTEAIRIGNPTTAVLLQKTQPIFVVLMARLLLHERLSARSWMWLGIALIAAYLVSFGATVPTELIHHAPPATLLALAAAVFWAGSTVMGRSALQGMSFQTLTALRIVIALPLLGTLVLVKPHPWPPFDPKQALSLLAMALVPGLAALMIYYRGLRNTRASLASVAELSFPATAALLNWTVLGAGVTFVQLAGFAWLWAAILAM
jgi:drug/metabolite transporter (DMT)-like permease